MQKFSITKLEEARRNPTAFAKSLLLKSAGNPRFSKLTAWKNSIYYFHSVHDLEQAIDYIKNTFKKNFKDTRSNRNSLEEYINYLEDYVDAFQKMKMVHFKTKERISLNINPELKITGEIPIICLNEQLGYDIYFLSQANYDYKSELKFPIIQQYFSEFFDCDISEIKVGIYSIQGNIFLLNSFSMPLIKDSLSELNNICEEILKNLFTA